MWISAALAVAFVLVPLPCWLLMARRTVVGAVVGGLLLVCAGLVVAADTGWITTRAEAELNLGYVPAAALLIAAGSFLDRKRGSGAIRGRAVVGGVLLGLYTALVLVVFIPLYKSMVLDDTLRPTRADVLPLPDGLIVQNDDGDDEEECSHICGRTLSIGSDRGLTPEQVEQRLRAALTSSHGWQLDQSGAACRANGRLLDRRRICIAVLRTPDGAQVRLQGYAPGVTPSSAR